MTDLDQAAKFFDDGRYEEALDIYRRLAEAGDAKAQFNLGLFHQHGWGFDEPDIFAAIALYEKAAAQNLPQALFILGMMYFNQHWALKEDNPTQGLAMVRRAAEMGLAEAQFNIGYDAETKGDYAAALEWYNKAAAQNLPQAYNNLGMMYENGLGVDRDGVRAYRYFQMAYSLDDHPRYHENLDRVAKQLSPQQRIEAKKPAP